MTREDWGIVRHSRGRSKAFAPDLRFEALHSLGGLLVIGMRLKGKAIGSQSFVRLVQPFEDGRQTKYGLVIAGVERERLR